jgi:hypothetical protein
MLALPTTAGQARRHGTGKPADDVVAANIHNKNGPS